MGEIRQRHAEKLEYLDVQRRGRQPFLAANDGRDVHQCVVDDVGEVVGRQAVRFEQHRILIVGGQVEVALDHVVEADARLVGVGRADADHRALARVKLRLNLFQRRIAPFRPFAVIAGLDALRLLLLAQLVEFCLRAEAG